jgi:hypothetical protein
MITISNENQSKKRYDEASGLFHWVVIRESMPCKSKKNNDRRKLRQRSLKTTDCGVGEGSCKEIG